MAENKTSVRKLLDGQEYNVAKGGIIKKGFGRKSAVEQCVAYLHSLSQLTVCPRYTGDLITSCTWLQLILVDNNTMCGAAQFMVDFQGMHSSAKKAIYINFQNHASIFHKAMLSIINGGGHDIPKYKLVTHNSH